MSEYTQEQLDQAVKEAVEKETSGLKAKANELMDEIKDNNRKRKEAEDAQKKSELDAAKAAGKVEEVEARLRQEYEERINALDGVNSSLNSEILSGKKSGLIDSLASNFESPEAAKLMLNGLVDVNRNENGEIVTTFNGTDGKAVGTDAGKFMEHLSQQDAFKSLIKGVDSSGGGANGGSKGSGGANAPSKLSEAKTDADRKAYYAQRAEAFNSLG